MRKRSGFIGAALAFTVLLGASSASAQISLAGSTPGCFSMSSALAGSCRSLSAAPAGFAFASPNASGHAPFGDSDRFFHLFVSVTAPSGFGPRDHPLDRDLPAAVNAPGLGLHAGDTVGGPAAGFGSGVGIVRGGGPPDFVGNTPSDPGSSLDPADVPDLAAPLVSTAPEPMTVLLFGSGLAGVLAARRRRKEQPSKR